ncbi:MAG TPA: PD-(D/E)XK nuclease family protein, partial [Sphingomonas sp.]|nr:PD-(D/E)XK nuclease family protein [Sphingomonas sp.]
ATRAEEWLAAGGALGPADRGVVPQNSWYRALDAAMETLGAVEAEDATWGKARLYAEGEAARRPLRPRAAPPMSRIPAWLGEPAPQESRPPRPLTPSAIGRDDVSDPPSAPAMRAAAERGRLLHQLFERLPGCPPEQRRAAAERWLTGSAGIADATQARSLAEDACAVLNDSRFAPLFAPQGLAEAPIAAVVEGEVIAGTVDRLLVEPDRVLVVDFKTGKRVPRDLAAAPTHHLAQMGAYAAALGVIFPGRRIEAALLYTAGPKLIALDAETLARHKPGLGPAEQSYAPAG